MSKSKKKSNFTLETKKQKSYLIHLNHIVPKCLIHSENKTITLPNILESSSSASPFPATDTPGITAFCHQCAHIYILFVHVQNQVAQLLKQALTDPRAFEAKYSLDTPQPLPFGHAQPIFIQFEAPPTFTPVSSTPLSAIGTSISNISPNPHPSLTFIERGFNNNNNNNNNERVNIFEINNTRHYLHNCDSIDIDNDNDDIDNNTESDHDYI